MNNKALETIYKNLNSGKVYGKDIYKWPSGNIPRFPFFERVLSADKNYIYWQYYGSSANKNTIKSLEWILKIIFETSPEEFTQKYITDDLSTIK